MRHRLVCCVLLAASLLPGLAFAQADGPSEEDMVKALAPRPVAKAAAEPAPAETSPDPEEATAPGGDVPGLRLRGRKAVTAKAAKEASDGAREGRLQLSVQFQLGSATILDESRSLLVRLGRAMKSAELAGLAYRIEGHTDATGTVEGNQRLSERRAESVTAFLIEATGLPEDRFVPVGRGSRQPLDPANPESGVNRRVVVVSLERAVAAAAASPPQQPAIPSAATPAPAAVVFGDGGRVVQTTGALDLQKAGRPAPDRAQPGARVDEGDLLITGPGASALLQLDDGANVLVRPDSSIRLAKLKHSGDGVGQLVQVIAGACRYVTGSIGRTRPATVALSTPTATVGVRGTDVEVAYRETGGGGLAAGTYVRVVEGGVAVGGLDGTKIELAKGEQGYAGRPARGLRGEPAGPAVKRVDAIAGIFAAGELDALLERRP